MAHAPGTWGYRRRHALDVVKTWAPFVAGAALVLGLTAIAYDFAIDLLASRVAAKLAAHGCGVTP